MMCWSNRLFEGNGRHAQQSVFLTLTAPLQIQLQAAKPQFGFLPSFPGVNWWAHKDSNLEPAD
jgi:hypothetical protein